jgi:hypothetical protein
MSDPQAGWHWFDETPDLADAQIQPQIEKSFARCFATADGRQVLDHLRAMTTERVMGPDASDAVLRHLEGQRHLVATIAGLIARGRAGNETI